MRLSHWVFFLRYVKVLDIESFEPYFNVVNVMFGMSLSAFLVSRLILGRNFLSRNIGLPFLMFTCHTRVVGCFVDLV